MSGEASNLPPASFLKLVSSSHQTPALSQGPCPALGGHKDHKAVKRDSDHEGRPGVCARGFVVRSGFLEEVILVWSLPSEVWS